MPPIYNAAILIRRFMNLMINENSRRLTEVLTHQSGLKMDDIHLNDGVIHQGKERYLFVG